MINIENIKLRGTISAISSKSMAHRHIIASALSDKMNKLYISNISEDIQKTIDCLIKLGANIVREDRYLIINPIDIEYIKSKNLKESILFDMGESGTTYRFMLPIISTLLNKSQIIGRGRLKDRPIIEFIDIIKKSGSIISNDKLPFTIQNKMSFSNVDIRGDISSQYISGLLLSSPLQNKDVKINVIGKLESKPYVDMTLKVMKEYNISVTKQQNSYIIAKENKYKNNSNHIVESDWSNSAFFLVAGAISKDGITIENLNFNSSQGDMQIIDILKKCGASIYIANNSITVKQGEFKANDIDVSNIPDLLPILSVLASACKGKTKFYNVSRLRFKESDRIKSTLNMINNLGGIAIEKDDTLIIDGKGYLHGGVVDSYNDHRIAMSASIASAICQKNIILKDEMAVNKSYIGFYEDFKKLGGKICHLL